MSYEIALRTSGELVTVPDEFMIGLPDTVFNGLESVEDVLAYALSLGIDTIESRGIATIDKETLVGKLFVIVRWEFFPSSDFGGDFVFAQIIGENIRGAITDGSTGICEQLKETTAERMRYISRHPEVVAKDGTVRYPVNGFLEVKGGLRVSEYKTVNENGTVVAINEDDPRWNAKDKTGAPVATKARTFYLS